MNYPHLAEEAVLQYLKTVAFTTLPADAATGKRNLYKGSDSPDGGYDSSQTRVELPCTIVACDSSVPYAQPAGNEMCEMSLYVRTQRDDESDAAHRARCAEVFSLFRAVGVEAQLSTPTFAVEFLILRPESGSSSGSRYLESVLHFTMFGAATSLAP